MNWRELLAPHRRSLGFLILLGLAQTGLAAAQVLWTTQAIDRLPVDPAGATRSALGLALCLALLAGAREVERMRAERLGHELVADLRVRLLESFLGADKRSPGRLGSGGMLLRSTGDLEALRRFVGQGLVRLPILVLSVVAALGVLANASPRLAAAVGLALLVAAGTSLWIGPRLHASLRGQRRTRARLAGEVQHQLVAAATIRANARGSRELASLSEASLELARLGSARARHSAGLRFIAQVAAGLGSALAIGLGAHEVGAGRASLGDVVASLTILGWLSGPVQELSRVFDNWHSAKLTREKLAQVLNQAPPTPTVAVRPSDGRLVLENLVLGERSAVDLYLDRGERLWIRGDSGPAAGTLARVIAGLEGATSGFVWLDGAPTQQLSEGRRRRSIGYCGPETQLIDGSLSKNLRYRLPTPADGELERVIAITGLNDLVGRLPAGLNTRLSGGMPRLSASERTRIGLARALLGSPELLVLEDFGAGLDALTRERLRTLLGSYPGWIVMTGEDPLCEQLSTRQLVSTGEGWSKRPAWGSVYDDPRTERLPGLSLTLCLLLLATLPSRAAAQETPLGDPTSSVAPTEDDPSPPPRKAAARSGWRWTDPGLVYRSPDQPLQLRIGGRLQLDFADYNATGVTTDDEVDIRRGRLSLSGRYHDHWRFSIERDFLGTIEGWTGVWGRYQADDWSVTVGNQVQPLGLDAQISSAMITFQERASVNALTPGFGMGVQARWAQDGLGFQAGLFSDPLDRDPARRAEGIGLVARAFKRFRDEHSPLRAHVGASTEFRPLEDGSRLRFRSRPESGLTSVRLVDTGNITGADRLATLGLELALDYEFLSLQSEWIQTRVERTGGDLDFGGGYVQLSGFLTGESRRYSLDRGVYRGPQPKSPYGALELALRLSTIDLASADITGGEQVGRSIALNWYYNEHYRVTLDFTRIEADPDDNGGNSAVDTIQLRLGLDF